MESDFSTFEEDFRWQERFRDHFSEIARLACRVEVASPEDDRTRNRDFILKPRKEPPISFSVRARRTKCQKYADTFSIRLRRASGAKTEMAKLLAGDGDMLIHGFESNLGSRRLHPWLLGDLDVLRQYIRKGGLPDMEESNDDGTTAAYFYRAKMPPGFIVEESVVADRMILEVMTTSPEISLCIAWRAGMPVAQVHRALLRLAGMENKHPSSEQPPDAQVVLHFEQKPGVPLMWSLRDCYCDC